MNGELESYFQTLGGLGKLVVATSRTGSVMTSADALDWVLAKCTAVKRDGARVFFVGNGGSAAIASHMATDWMKNGGFAALSFNDGAQLTCLANDLGYSEVFATPLRSHVREGDLLIAISSSGRSGSIVGAVGAARDKGADVITLSGFAADNPLRALGDINFYVPNDLYGFVEIAHLSICHAFLDLAMGWRANGTRPTYVSYPAGSGT